MNMPPASAERGEMLRLRGRESRVRFWTPEEWVRLPEIDRPCGAFRFGNGLAVVETDEHRSGTRAVLARS